MSETPGIVDDGDGKTVDGYEHQELDSSPDSDYDRTDTDGSDKPSETTEATSEPVEEPAKEPESPEKPEESSEEPNPMGLSHNGREFKDVREIFDYHDQASSSWEGRIRKEQEKNVELASRLEEYWNYIQASETAKLEEGAKPSTTEAVTETGAKKETGAVKKGDSYGELVDLEEIQRVMEVAQKSGVNPNAVGFQMLAEQLSNQFDKRLDERITPITESIQETAARKEETEAQSKLFVWAQSEQKGNGDSVYPELAVKEDGSISDALPYVHSAFEEIARVNPHFAYTAMGFDYAYRLGMEIKAEAGTVNASPGETPGNGKAPVPPTSAPSEPARDDKGRYVSAKQTDVRISSALTGTNPSLTEKEKLTEGEAMLKRLGDLKTVKRGETELGFYD